MTAETDSYPHIPAAFINAIAEEGTKEEAVQWLQKLWNENCALRKREEQKKAKKHPWPDEVLPAGILKNISALADAARLSYNENELRPALEEIRDMARNAVICGALRSAPPVTDEMVERAKRVLISFDYEICGPTQEKWCKTQEKWCKENPCLCEQVARAALIAALAHRGGEDK